MWTEITKYWAKVVQILGNFLEFESLDFSSFAYHDTPECHGGHYAKKHFYHLVHLFTATVHKKNLEVRGESERVSSKSFLKSWAFTG